MLCWDLKIQCTTIRILGCTLFCPDRFVCLDDGRTVGQEGKSLQMLWGEGVQLESVSVLERRVASVGYYSRCGGELWPSCGMVDLW